jgi:hypothetical protein
MATYSGHSPYVTTPQNSWYLGYYNHRSILPNITDDLVVIEQKHQHRPDLLSYDMYGTVDFWWVFAARNMDLIKDPIYDLNAGMQIYVPSMASISSMVF